MAGIIKNGKVYASNSGDLNYKDITSYCIFDTDAIGSNGNLPKVYQNCNSIVIDWNRTTIDVVKDVLDYGHIKIPKNSNCTYILSETFVTVSDSGSPKGIVRVYIAETTDDNYILLRIPGQIFTGTITTGTDTIRGITEIKYIQN